MSPAKNLPPAGTNSVPHDDEHDDDKPIGRLLSRREVLALIGGSGAALLFGAGFTRVASARQAATATSSAAATAFPTCVVRPEMTEGPYFVDTMLNRRDIRFDSAGNVKPGIPMRLIFNVSSITANACTPLEGAQVDIWHCDAEGEYSGVQDGGFDTTGEYWLRGYQVTDANGIAEFITIYPGWYSGRAVHIHFKIRVQLGETSAYEFTSQLFFPEDMNALIFEQEPYAAKGLADTPNARDSIYQNGGDQLLLAFNPITAAALTEAANAQSTAEPESTPEPIFIEQDGYEAIFSIGLDLTDASVGAADGFGRR